MLNASEQQVNYQRIAKAIQFLRDHQSSQPQLADLSQFVGVSEYHLQRIFSKWAGVSPKQFLQYLTKEKAKQLLRENSVLDTAFSCGLSSSSRLHDLMLHCESVTPGEYRAWGKGLNIAYGIHASPFGYCLLALTHRGLCKLSFFDEPDEGDNIVVELRAEWPDAVITRDQSATEKISHQIFSAADYKQTLSLLLKGSPFQIKVWEALLKIPEGSVFSYQQLASVMGRTSSVRAVASAIAQNSIGYLIPCHRVIRSTGVLNNYRWGDVRKAAIIGWEGCRFTSITD